MDRTKTKLCFLDWNGTVQDDMHHIYECGVERIFRHFRLPCPSLDTYRHEVTHDFMIFYHAHGIPKGVTADDLNAIMREGFKEKGVPPAVFGDAHQTVVSIRAHGYDIAVVSGYAQAKLDAAIERNGMTTLFSHVVGDVRDKNSEYSKIVAARSPSRVIGIGDSIDDAFATLHVGGRAYLCSRGFPPEDKLHKDAEGHDGILILPTLWDIALDLNDHELVGP